MRPLQISCNTRRFDRGSAGDADDVAGWVRGLGLEQYEPAFRDNDVDAVVLPELTADDLISIGVGFVTATLSSTHREPRLAARHAAATASCHCAVASARKIRSVDREMRWR